MLGNLLTRANRAALIAYGGWALLTVALIGGTLTSLSQAEHAQTQALLARAEAGAAATEQTMVRVLDAVQSIQSLVQTRIAMIENEDAAGRQASERILHDIVTAHRFGVQDVSVFQDGQLDWTSLNLGQTDPTTDAAPPSAANARRAAAVPDVDSPVFDTISRHWSAKSLGLLGGAVAAAAPSAVPLIEAPAFDSVSRRWSIRTVWPLRDGSGAINGQLVVWLDPIALSHMIAQQTSGVGVVSAVQRRSDGAFLARSQAPLHAMTEHPSTEDPFFGLALRNRSGHFQDGFGGVHRFVGFRASPQAPIVVSQSFDTDAALADFYKLRRIVLAVVLALVGGAFTATRVILANYLLRDKLSEQAILDPLTGLYNRRYFTDTMAQRCDQARNEGLSAAILLIDLDGFKQVNDTRGHPVGDALLCQVADRLRACCGPGDVVLRLGGDEFAVVRLSRQVRRDVTTLARGIVGELARTIEVDGYHLRISASVGVALSPTGGNTLNAMLQSADIALYFVKADGGDAYRVFDPAMEDTVRTRRALELDLREALGRTQFEVYFQPLVQLEPRRVCGFEALLRWHHPVLGMVMPSRFIPIAEETGLIASIGEWVLRRACNEAANWPPTTRLAVNLSPVQFERSDMVDIVASALRDSRLDPFRLELEITEGVVMRNVGDVLSTMRRLHALGVRLALDDFGTGYSSLSYLRSFPFDKVKIDASFLADLNGDGGTIIRAVLGLCGHLRLDSLVEGVETEDQLEWLRLEGCTEVQGHLFSPPRPAGGVRDVIADVAARIPSAVMGTVAE
jgi:diguanylate cyclase (GGDEF)-like protein